MSRLEPHQSVRAESDELNKLTLKEMLDILDNSDTELAVCSVEGGQGPALIVAATGTTALELADFLEKQGIQTRLEQGVQA